MKLKKLRTPLIYLLLLAMIIFMVTGVNFDGNKPDTPRYSEFLDMVRNDQVKAVQLTEKTLYGLRVDSQYNDKDFFEDGKYDFSVVVSPTTLIDDLNKIVASKTPDKTVDEITVDDYGFTFQYNPTPQPSLFLSLLPYLLIAGGMLALFFYMQNQGSKSAMSFGKSRARVNVDGKNKVTFDDVAGADEEKEELREVVEFLRSPQRFSEMGARIPKGVLLMGPPGTGKTLLARASAGEADVPFFSISGSDFMEMFVGVGASRVRDLFNTAKRCAPAIVFIDEIDAVGRQRGTGLGGGHDEREQTLNQLLVEMDGFAPNEGIIVMAATNRADVLDPALLRPGRFDRQITVYPPDRKGRFEILKVHSRNKPLSAEVDLDQMAKRTPGFTGADLENILNEAAILSARKNKREITPDELEEAVSRVTMGPEKRSRVITEADKRITAYHEAGHAVVQHKLAKKEKIQEISIIPRGEAAGYTVSLPENDEMHVSKGKLLDFIAMLLGGRVAEEVALDDISTGASNDLQRASELARRMVTEWGMSDRIGPVCLASREEIFIGREWGHRNNYSEEIAARVDAEVRHILDEQYERARHTLEENRAGVDAVAKALIEYERLSGEEFEKVFSGEPVDLDKRADKRAEQVEQAAQSDSNLPEDTEKGRLNPDGSRTSD